MVEAVEVFSGGGGPFRAESLRALLESEGIDCIVSTHGIAGHPFTVGPMARFSLLVAPDDAERARDVLMQVQVPAEDE